MGVTGLHAGGPHCRGRWCVLSDEVVSLSLLTVEDVSARLPYPVEDEHVEGVVREVIVDASNLARHYGRPTWTASVVPPVVKTEVRNACVRALVLLDGVVQSRAGDESEMFTDLRSLTGTVFFTRDQQQTIREAAGGGGNMSSVTSFRYGLVAVSDRGRHPRAGFDGRMLLGG